MSKSTKLHIEQINPNPKLVALINFAINETVVRLSSPWQREEYANWLIWAQSWKAGERQPQACVDIASHCFKQKEQLVNHSLGQIAWGAKEACYSTPVSGWYVVRYIADAMIAFGVAFPEQAKLIDPPTINSSVEKQPKQITI